MYVLKTNHRGATELTEKFTEYQALRKTLQNIIFSQDLYNLKPVFVMNTESGFSSQVTVNNFDFVVRRIH